MASLSSRTGLTECFSSSDSLAQNCLLTPSDKVASTALCCPYGRIAVLWGNFWASLASSQEVLPLGPYLTDLKTLDTAQSVPRISHSGCNDSFVLRWRPSSYQCHLSGVETDEKNDENSGEMAFKGEWEMPRQSSGILSYRKRRIKGEAPWRAEPGAQGMPSAVLWQQKGPALWWKLKGWQGPNSLKLFTEIPTGADLNKQPSATHSALKAQAPPPAFQMCLAFTPPSQLGDGWGGGKKVKGSGGRRHQSRPLLGSPGNSRRQVGPGERTQAAPQPYLALSRAWPQARQSTGTFFLFSSSI